MAVSTRDWWPWGFDRCTASRKSTARRAGGGETAGAQGDEMKRVAWVGGWERTDDDQYVLYISMVIGSRTDFEWSLLVEGRWKDYFPGGIISTNKQESGESARSDKWRELN